MYNACHICRRWTTYAGCDHYEATDKPILEWYLNKPIDQRINLNHRIKYLFRTKPDSTLRERIIYLYNTITPLTK